MLELSRRRSSAPGGREPLLAPVRLGAELVHLAELLYVRIFGVAVATLIVGCGLTLWFSTLEHGSPRAMTWLFVTGAAALGAVALVRPRSVYLRLRSTSWTQLAPAALGAVAVLLDGPGSQCWWIALPLLWIVAVVSSTRLAVGAATITGLAFVAGTTIRGHALIGPQDTGVLPAAVGLPAYTLVARVLVDGFAGLVLGRHHSALALQQLRPPPLPVPNLAAAAAAMSARAPSTPAAPQPRRPPSHLTARQLEVTLLLRDGLRQTEIADCLGISTRQVERLLAAARQRVGAATTSQLTAMLASGALSSASPQAQPAGAGER